MSETDDDITCKELIEFIGSYLAGDLPPPERREFERHLAGCPACVEYLDAYRRAGQLARDAFRDDARAPEDLPEDLVRAIVAARTRH